MPLEQDQEVRRASAYDRLSPEEVDAEIQALTTSANWRRVEVIAAGLRGGIPWMSRDDLLQEALVRLLAGRKKWPRGVHPVVVMEMVMHSIASDARKHDKRSPVEENLAVADGTSTEGSPDDRPSVHGAITITPEEQAERREEIAAVDALVAGDEELQLLVMAWADGLRGTDAAEALGWEMKTYEAARKRLVRRLDSLDSGRRQK